MKNTILIIDDDVELNRLLSAYLAQFDFEAVTAADPTQGLQLLKSARPALIVLDVMLPERNGFELCTEIRKTSTVPIIMLTARGDLSDRIVGLELGADDYLPKPYEPRELVARIQSVLRRTLAGPAAPSRKSVLRSGELMIDPEQGKALLGAVDLELTTAEFSVLSFLMTNAGKTVSRDEIFQQVRGAQWDSVDRSVDMVVSRIRHKLKDDSRHSRFLKTIWGEGYRFVGPITDA